MVLARNIHLVIHDSHELGLESGLLAPPNCIGHEIQTICAISLKPNLPGVHPSTEEAHPVQSIAAIIICHSHYERGNRSNIAPSATTE